MNKWAISALLIASFLCAAADGPKKDKPAKEKAAKKSSNDSLRTQQKTADALANRLSGLPTSRPSDTQPATPQLQAKLDDIDDKIQAENDRFDALLTQLNEVEQSADEANNEKDAAKARRSIEKARVAHAKTVAGLQKQREDLVRKKDPAPSSDAKSQSDRKKSKS